MIRTRADAEFQRYFRGDALIGDDYDADEIASWFADEAEGYASLGANDRQKYSYGYHELNRALGFSRLGQKNFENALGVGSAYGDEFIPIADRLGNITILDPSDYFTVDNVAGVPVRFIKPDVTGTMPFKENSFDLLTCLGVLHHIPNVSHVISEFYRVLRPGGFALIREPVVNMGDWRKPRSGLTRHERGIPLHYMDAILQKAGLTVISRVPCGFPLTSRISRLLRLKAQFNSPLMVRLDVIICRLMLWNWSYARPGLLKKFTPTSVYWVCHKNSA